jgi:uncharacterized protein
MGLPDRSDFSPRHLMLLPSLACQAQCSYCFGPNQGSVMPPEIFDAALDWMTATTPPHKPLELTFHGGEPLIAGQAWYRRNLPLLRHRFGDRLKLGIQSNLWLLDDSYSELFREYEVSIGTSLDGPETINDAQRGAGYFARTMAGIKTARRHGLTVGVICTFTRLSAPRYQEVFEFFASQGLDFSVHAAVCGLNGTGDDAFALTTRENADLFIALFDHYQTNITRTRISTFDSMARGISAGQGGLCTFSDCLGGYLTLAPDGGIFSCNRFAHHPEWRLGSVQEQPSLDELSRSPAWQKLRQRELSVHEDCVEAFDGDCAHFAYCKGGCAYNASVGGSDFGCSADRRDPHCEAYRRVFSHISDRALAEVFGEENLAAVVEHGPNGHGMLQRGPLLQIMRGGPHPRKVAARARETVACVALAVSASTSNASTEALRKLAAAGAITDPLSALASLTGLHERLHTTPRGLVNAYLHITYACNLECAHCYASSGPRADSTIMAVADVGTLVRQAAAAGFGKAVITGGEPLAHPQRDALLDALAELRPTVKPLQIVLRTNLVAPLSETLLARLMSATDLVVVSLDGDEAGHDARRGPGAYARTVANLRQLAEKVRDFLGGCGSPRGVPACQVQLAATLSAADTAGAAGAAVRALGRELDLPVRFKPVLPLGRATTDHGLAPERYSSLDDDVEAVACAPAPRATCGLGMNLYIEPDGACFPCYALTGSRHDLGNALADGLAAVLAANDTYRRVTVDSNERCGRCSLRYLCGGACRAWSVGGDPDAGPGDCTALHTATRERLTAALVALGISEMRWLAAGLPLSAAPPELAVTRIGL